MREHRGNQYFAVYITALLLSLVAIPGWTAGPTAESTVAFLNSKYQQYGGGYTMVSTTEGNYRYSRTFPLSISMAQDGLLVVKRAERSFERAEGEDDPEAINRDLAALDSEGATIRSYLIPLERMEFGTVSNRRGDWRALKTLKKSTAKVRVLCKEKQRCIEINNDTSEEDFDLFVVDENSREKVFNALKHLIGLYQHRKELF
jgi:hypothetical protein